MSDKELQERTRALFQSLEGQVSEARDRVRNYGHFLNYGWESFDPVVAANLIMGPEKYIFGLKQILLSGLVAWVCAPNAHRTPHLKKAVAITVADKTAQIGERIMRPLGFENALLPMFAPLIPEYYLFYSEIFFPIGGIQAIRDTKSTLHITNERRRWASSASLIAKQIGIFHFVVSEIAKSSNPNQKMDFSIAAPSRHRSIKHDLYKSIHYSPMSKADARARPSDLHPSIRKMADINKSYEANSAYIYAASRVDCEDRSLLELLFEGSTSYDQIGMYVREWVRKARFVQESILSYCHRPNPYKKYAMLIPSVPALHFSHPLELETDQDLVLAAYRK